LNEAVLKLKISARLSAFPVNGSERDVAGGQVVNQVLAGNRSDFSGTH
jgi:hypothetical protein